MVNKQDMLWITASLSSFGVTGDEQKVYLCLLRRGELIPSVLSRETGINRTTLYRILESLTLKGLISEVMKYKSRKFKPAPPEQLNLIITQKEAELSHLKQELPKLSQELTHIIPPIYTATYVLYFKGRQGLRQLLYNTLNAKSEVVGFGYGNWNDGVGYQFTEKLRHEYVTKNIKAREILNKLDEHGSFTKIPDYFNVVYKHRCISNKILLITHDTYIYNDVFAFYHTVNGEYFGVEIHNEAIAHTQKQLFEIIWKLAIKNKV